MSPGAEPGKRWPKKRSTETRSGVCRHACAPDPPRWARHAADPGRDQRGADSGSCHHRPAGHSEKENDYAQTDRIDPCLARRRHRSARTVGQLRRRGDGIVPQGAGQLRRLRYGPGDLRELLRELGPHLRLPLHRPHQRHAQVRRIPITDPDGMECHPPRARPIQRDRPAESPARQASTIDGPRHP